MVTFDQDLKECHYKKRSWERKGPEAGNPLRITENCHDCMDGEDGVTMGQEVARAGAGLTVSFSIAWDSRMDF